MYFVLHQYQENGKTYENNTRLGGFRTLKGARNAARKHAPALVRDHTRRIIVAFSTVNHNIEGESRVVI